MSLLLSVAGLIGMDLNGQATHGYFSVNKADGRCVMHVGGLGLSGKTDLAVWPHPGLPTADIYVMEREASVSTVKAGLAIVTIGTADRPLQANVEIIPSVGGLRTLKISVPNSALSSLRANESIELRGSGFSWKVVYGKIAEGVDQLGGCELALIKSWGVDPRRLRPMLLPGQAGFIDIAPIVGASYPEQAKRGGAQGRAVALLSLSPSGLPQECRITESTGNQSLDAKTCELALRYERYPPYSKNVEESVASWVMFTVRWQLVR